MSELTQAQRIDRAHRAKMAMDEFIAPALAEIEGDYAEKMIGVAASSDPRAPEVIARLANGIKVARQVREAIERHIADGKMAEAERNRSKKIEDMTDAKRRLLQIGAH